MRRVRFFTVISGVALVSGLLAGCSSSSDEPPTTSGTTSPSPTATVTESPTPAQESWESMIATASGDSVDVYAAPDDAEPSQTITAEEVVSLPGEIPLTFLVVQRQEDWVQVNLPVRPNGSTGWLRSDTVTFTTTEFSVEVLLSEHLLRLHKAGAVVMEVPVGVGRAEVPTPGGVYYIKELLQPPTPGGPYGAYAYGLSGYSPVLESFAGGEGVIGIHGTNEPELVGTDVSHGCIRLLDSDITRLVEEFGLPLGTPVEIVE